MNTLKSLLLLTLAFLVAFSSYSNYQMLARTQLHQPPVKPATQAVFHRASYDPQDRFETAVARSDSEAVLRSVMHGLRLNVSLAIFLLFAVAISMKERTK